VTGELDRGLLARLSCGHAAADLCQGSVPALLPFFVLQRGWSYAAAGILVLAMTVGSSIIQPLFGAVADRLEMRWLMPGGVLLAGAGIALSGVVHSYGLTVLVVAISGIGVAAFHPEGARFANHASGARRGTGMSFFSVGGNVGFALGPILATPLVLLFGLSGTLALVVLPALAAVMLLRAMPRMQAMAASSGERRTTSATAAKDDWNAFGRLGGGVAAALLGVLADAAGLSAVMWTIALLPVPGLLLALTLPPTPQDQAQSEERRSSKTAPAPA
jgi:FSR family fosmidomycin resistance protein-like MFS transporter